MLRDGADKVRGAFRNIEGDEDLAIDLVCTLATTR